MRLTTDQGTAAADQPHTAIAADLQIRPRQTAGLPEPLQKAPRPVIVAACESQNPARSIAGIQNNQTQFRPQPAGQLRIKIQASQREGSIAPLACTIAGCASLPRRCHRLGIGGQPGGIGQPMQGEGGIPGNESRGPGKPQRLLCQRNRTAAINPPEQAGREQ